jgi:hypothetical protein
MLKNSIDIAAGTYVLLAAGCPAQFLLYKKFFLEGMCSLRGLTYILAPWLTDNVSESPSTTQNPKQDYIKMPDIYFFSK